MPKKKAASVQGVDPGAADLSDPEDDGAGFDAAAAKGKAKLLYSAMAACYAHGGCSFDPYVPSFLRKEDSFQCRSNTRVTPRPIARFRDVDCLLSYLTFNKDSTMEDKGASAFGGCHVSVSIIVFA